VTADLINLRLKRKAKKRDQATELAAENRAKYGRSKAEKSVTAQEQALAAKNLDGHKRDD
jgi:Domain of unknown function (DUF4169)